MKQKTGNPGSPNASDVINVNFIIGQVKELIYKNDAKQISKFFADCPNPIILLKRPIERPKTTTLLHYACDHSDIAIAIIKTLLQCGANTKAKDYKDRTALDHAVKYGRSDLMELLLVHGAVVTPKMMQEWERRKWHIESQVHGMLADAICVQTLHPRLNADISNLTPYDRIHAACSVLQTPQGRRILVNRLDNNGSNLAFTACWYGRFRVLQLLIDYGAELSVKNVRGNTVAAMAVEKDHEECVQVLLLNGIKFTKEMVKNIENRTGRKVNPEILKIVEDSVCERIRENPEATSRS